ncbi:MAG: nucleotidyltransferase domain-containing protein [Blastocatellia bacterium]
MKPSARKSATKKSAKAPRIRRKLVPESELPPEAQALRRQFREWHESYSSPAKRMAYIQDICARIAHAYHPEKIILFGSHAYGQPTPESDVDLMIVMDYEGRPVEQSIKISLELGIFTPMDLHVRSPKDIEARLQDGDMFIVDIMRRGKVMYESEHA